MSGTIEIGPRAEATKDFHLALPQGEVLAGRASIAPDDLPLDDSFSFVVSSNLGPRVLVVNGAPSTIPHRDEVHYLTRALRVVSTPQGPLRTTVVTPDEPVDLAGFDVIFLCNIAAGTAVLGDLRVRELEAAIRRGAGLVVTVGANTNAKTFAGNIDRLLPATLHTENARSPTTPLATMTPSSDHPETRAFKEAANVGSPPPAFIRAIVLLPRPGAPTETLLRFSDGTPALIEQALDAGRVLVFASTIDRDWTDLPIRPLFAPWIADLVDALTPKSGVDRARRLSPGDAIPIPAGADVVVTGPSGFEETRGPRDSRAVIAGRVGLHKIEIRGAGRNAKPTSTMLAVTPDPAESNVMRAAATPSDARTPLAARAQNAKPQGPPLMTAFALALLVLLLAEAIVVSRR